MALVGDPNAIIQVVSAVREFRCSLNKLLANTNTADSGRIAYLNNLADEVAGIEELRHGDIE